MNLDDYKVQRKMLEGSIRLAVDNAIEKFQKTTDHCPGEIKIEMVDVTNFVQGTSTEQWRIKKRFKVRGVHACVEI